MIITQHFKLSALIMIFVVFAVYTQEALADHVRIFVNNVLVKPGTKVEVISTSPLHYEFHQTSPEPIELDLTGDSVLKHILSGPKAEYATVYNPSIYHPRINSGSEAHSFSLSVTSPFAWVGEVTKVIPQVIWPLVTLIVFLVLCIWGKLYRLVQSFRPSMLEFSGIKITSADLEVSLRNEIDKSIKILEKAFPREIAPQYIRVSGYHESAYYVHVIEFLHTVKANIDDVNAWIAVGSYYFWSDKKKSFDAYVRAIE